MTRDLKCADCEQQPTLNALDNGGIVVSCDCTSIDTLPYDVDIECLPGQWFIVRSYPSGSSREEQMRNQATK